MRLVLDTNVIVAAFRSRNGTSNLLLRFVDRGVVTPHCSTALFLEYEAVLTAADFLKARAGTAKRGDLTRLLDRAPDVPPTPKDAIKG